MERISESEVVVLLEELKNLGLLINRHAIELVIKEKQGTAYKIVLRTIIVHVEVNPDGAVQAYEVTREDKLLASHYV